MLRPRSRTLPRLSQRRSPFMVGPKRIELAIGARGPRRRDEGGEARDRRPRRGARSVRGRERPAGRRPRLVDALLAQRSHRRAGPLLPRRHSARSRRLSLGHRERAGEPHPARGGVSRRRSQSLRRRCARRGGEPRERPDTRGGPTARPRIKVGSFGTSRLTLGVQTHDEPTGSFSRVSAFHNRADNDYAIDVETPDAVGRLSPARVYRFHDAYSAGGVNAETGFIKRPWAKRLLVRDSSRTTRRSSRTTPS